MEFGPVLGKDFQGHRRIVITGKERLSHFFPIYISGTNRQMIITGPMVVTHMHMTDAIAVMLNKIEKYSGFELNYTYGR